ncbi:MAG TPA: amidohydrolase family protein [Blastocatellia bacterium]|nr:amidohydrolase family protein [Blastocatellia bacterium]
MILIENGEVYAPQPCGRQSVLIAGERIERIGEADARAIERAGFELSVIDATGCCVTPGFIDPHEHLIGGSGEDGFATQTPAVTLGEIVTAGITTVVGCLGVDTTTKTMPGLLARAKALGEEGLTAFIWSGGYNVPPVTLTGSVRSDLLFVAEVIGAGEIAISDVRSTQPEISELARLVSDAYVGGLLSCKAGVTHFHVGDGRAGLQPLRTLIDEYEIAPRCLYPTHVERRRELLGEAAELTRRGAFADIDTMAEDLPQQLRFFLEDGGDLNRLTVSSDAAISSPRTLSEQLRACVIEYKHTLEQMLPLVTMNTARALGLERKGRLAPGAEADVLVLRRGTLEITHVIARGRLLVNAGRLTVTEKFLAQSNRRIELYGSKS